MHLQELHDTTVLQLEAVQTCTDEYRSHINNQNTTIEALESRVADQDSQIQLLQSDLQKARESGFDAIVSTNKKLHREERHTSLLLHALNSMSQQQRQTGRFAPSVA